MNPRTRVLRQDVSMIRDLFIVDDNIDKTKRVLGIRQIKFNSDGS